MNLQLASGQSADLCYCANVHPGSSLADLWRALDAAQSVRRQLGVQTLGLGLWLSLTAKQQLLSSGGSTILSAELESRGLEVFSINGFPVGDFHAPVVKRTVYRPDWADPLRSAHTLELAHILAAVIPGRCQEGSISTLPLAHREQHVGPAAEFLNHCARALCALSDDLDDLAQRTGVSIRVCLEPEPGCLLESTDQAIRFWHDHLLAEAGKSGDGPRRVSQHLGLCFDTCHQAVAFEVAETSLSALAAAEIPIGKVQLSSAVQVDRPEDAEYQAALGNFDEPRFLHQVRTRDSQGTLCGTEDLGEVRDLPTTHPWRVHFHVPIHRKTLGIMSTTQEFLRSSLAWISNRSAIPHLEVETYTWSVLPAHARALEPSDLCEGIANELRWTMRQLGVSGE